MELSAREQRGLILAATAKLQQKGKVWIVPSQTGNGKKYTVCPDADCPYCSCPDHEETGQPCKHIFAVRTVIKREQAPDGTVTETRVVTVTEKKTYRTPDWPMYNLAQKTEKGRFLVLLRDLCRGLPELEQNRTGRRRTAVADMVFSMMLKVYTGLSCRRFGSDLAECAEKGYVKTNLNPVMVCEFMQCPLLTPVLKSLIQQSAAPLAGIETTFAPDSTGFSTSRFVRWFDEKYGRERSGKDWVKVHAIVGTKTCIVTSVEIEGRDAGDAPLFKPLVERTAENFNVREVCADKGYLSNENLAIADRIGATAYIPFKTNSTPGAKGSLWEKMYHTYQLHREEWEKHYHQRSLVETAFSAAKAKFGDCVKSEDQTAMKNEALCKLLAHNICVLIRSQLELGIEADFWGSEESEPEAIEVAPVAEPVKPVATQPVRTVIAPTVAAQGELFVPRQFAVCGA